MVASALERGLIINSPRLASVRLIPPLVVEERYVDEAIAVFEQVL